MTHDNWIRWIGSVAAAGALFIVAVSADVYGITHIYGLLLYLGLAVLPCYISISLLAFGKFWWSLPLGLWMLGLAFITIVESEAAPMSVILFVCALTVCYMPFLHEAQRRQDNPPTEAQSGQQPAPDDGESRDSPKTGESPIAGGPQIEA